MPVLHSDAMFEKPLPLFSAFLGGCLFTAAVIGFGGSDRRPRAVTPSERSVNGFVSALEMEPEIESEIQPPPASPKAVDDAETAEETGRSVADVLARLETAYRKVSVEPTTEASAAPVPVPAPSATPEPAPSTTAASAVAAVPATVPANAAAVAESATATPPSAGTEPAAVTEPAPATYVAEAQPDIRVGDVNPGDRYPIEDLVVLQYLQLLALSSYTGLSVPPPRAPHARARGPGLRQTPRAAFPITAIPNPDNPWGYNFPPPALVK
jgi:hypothetical protein